MPILLHTHVTYQICVLDSYYNLFIVNVREHLHNIKFVAESPSAELFLKSLFSNVSDEYKKNLFSKYYLLQF